MFTINLNSKSNFTKHINNLALTAMEILFLIALGLKPKVIKKRLECMAGKWQIEIPKPFAPNNYQTIC